MKRRSFLKGMAVAPAAAPVAVQEAMKSAAPLLQGGLVAAGESDPSEWRVKTVMATAKKIGGKEFYAERLKELMGMTSEAREYERLMFRAETVEPDLSQMRSMSAVTKVRWSRDRQYERDRARQISRCNAAIFGWLD